MTKHDLDSIPTISTYTDAAGTEWASTANNEKPETCSICDQAIPIDSSVYRAFGGRVAHAGCMETLETMDRQAGRDD